MRKIIIFFLFLVLIVAVCLGIFYAMFDINSYRDDIEKKLSSSMGFPVEIVGNMRLKKTLTPTISIPELRVQKTSKQGNVPFMVFKNVDFTFDFASYLKNIYDVSDIHVKNAQMFFDVNGAAPDGEQTEGLISGSQSRRPSLHQKNVFTLSVHYVNIDSAELIYQDHVNNISKQLSFSKLTISDLRHISGVMNRNQERFQFKGQFSDLVNTLKTGMNLVLDCQIQARQSLNDWKIMIPNLKTLDLVRMTLQSRGDSFAQTVKAFDLPLPESIIQYLPDKPFTVDASVDVINQRQLKTSWDINVPDSFSFQVDPFIWDLQKQTEYSGSIQFQTFAEEVLKDVNIRQLTANAQFVVTPEKIQMDKVSFLINSSNLDGKVVVLRGDKPKIAANLTSQYLSYQDFDELWNRTGDKPLDWVLNQVELAVSITIQHLDDYKLTTGYPYVRAYATSRDKTLTIRILEPSSFAAGRVVGQIQAVQLDNTVQANVQLLGDNILLNQIAPLKSQVRGGYANLNINLKSVGNTWEEMWQNLTGNVAVVLQEGELLSASQTLNKLAANKATTSYHVYTHRNIFVKNAIFNLAMKKGVVSLDHNVGIETSNWLDFIIDGSVNLPQQTLNLQIYPLRVAKIATVPDPDPSKYITIAGPWDKVKVQTKTRKTPMQDGEAFLRQLQKRTQLISIDNYLGKQARVTTATPVKKEAEKKAPVSVEQQVVQSLSEIVSD